jgi:hypothetical protein
MKLKKLKKIDYFFLVGVSVIFSLYFIFDGGRNSNMPSNDPSNDSMPSECQGNGDESFIRSKMSQMNRDVLELNKVGYRKYYVKYISWSSGSAVDEDQIFDYSNSACHD